MIESGTDSAFGRFFKKKGSNLSIPGELLLFRFRSFFFTMPGVIVTVMSFSPCNLDIGGGNCSVFSVEKTRQKYLITASTFSMRDVAFEPSPNFKVVNFTCVFSLELAYFQNNLGLCLTFVAIFSSKDAQSDLLSFLISFLH